MKQHISLTEQRVLVFVGRYIKKNGYSPLQREIGEYLGFKVNQAQRAGCYINRLHQKGVIKLGRGHRNIELIEGK